jgi:NAD(P)-dependent dehydrogenase (short-subunit alcohol dehydrogenase family)
MKGIAAMVEKRLDGQRVLVTQAKDYMGPATIELFREHGAEVIADESDLTQPGEVDRLIAQVGHLDILIANLATDAHLGTMTEDIDDDIWLLAFDRMVHPLHQLCRAVLPQMYKRRQGKIVAFGSATGLKALEGVTAYAAARSAQVGYVRNLGAEAARHNVQVNLIAQNFVENPVYFPPEFTETPEFKALLTQVPIGRLATGREDALFALFLASDESNFFVGQSIPFSGGWAQ